MKPEIAEVASDQSNGPNSDASRELESAAANETKKLLAAAAVSKLRRFCYLGTIESPVYSNTFLEQSVELHFVALRELCNGITGEDMAECLKSVLNANSNYYLPRHDEALLVLAVYLSSCTNEEHRTLVRSYFPEFVATAKELFLFINFVKRIQKLMERKTPFSRTVRKAVLNWYQNQSPDMLLHMWSLSDSSWSQHRDLLLRCHYTSLKCEAQTMAAMRVLTMPAKELVKWPNYLDPIVHLKETIIGIASMRMIQTADLALPIIKRFSLSYEHVPRHVVTNANVVNLLLDKMNYEQLLHTWPVFLRVYNSKHSEKLDYTQRFFDESKLKAANIEPIRLLLQGTRGIKQTKISKGVVLAKPPSFIHKLYQHSFGLNKALGLRMHITINLEMCYIGKSLTGRWRSVKYLDAVVALAFGYFKCDPEVNVRIWHDKSGKLKRLPWSPDMSVDEAKACCENQKVIKIKQTLTDALEDADLDTRRTYDVFLVLVPRGARGNPGNKSDILCKGLDEYRLKRNVNAKFIIMSLRQHHASMSYSKVRNENILELCSISEQTPRLINAFARDKFF